MSYPSINGNFKLSSKWESPSGRINIKNMTSILNINESIPINSVISTINVGVNPSGIAVTPDNKFAYVANNNNVDVSNQDTVSVINLETNFVIKIITHDSFNEPYTVTMNLQGSKVYITNSGSTTISVISTYTNEVISVIGGLDGPSGMAIMPSGNIAYVNNYGYGANSGTGTTVSIIDLNSNSLIKIKITVGLAPSALAITSDGSYVYVINYMDGKTGTGTVSIINTSTNTVTDNIKGGLSGPYNIVISSSNGNAYVTNFGSNDFAPIGTTVSIINTGSNKITSTIQLGLQPAGIVINPNGSFAYVTNYNSPGSGSPGEGTINIIDLYTNSLINPTITVGQAPGAIAISSDGIYLYVAGFISNTVSVIKLK